MLNKTYKKILSALSVVTLLVLFAPQAFATQLQEEDYVIINAHKIICEEESDLPNWGDGGGPGTIVSSTAQDFVDDSDGDCWFADEWDFQWGFDDHEFEDGVDKLNGTLIGEADGTTSSCTWNCGSNTDTGGDYNDWKTFDTSASGSSAAKAFIDNLEGAPGIWVREILKEDYIPFTYPTQGQTEDDETAEIYCHADINNFDNFDLVWDPEIGESFYCVAFNVPEEDFQEETDPELMITKSNDSGGSTLNQGDSVTFTIVVESTGTTTAFNVTVTDLPAGGFNYNGGSWTANSDVRGDISGLGEPTYASPGDWNLGDMLPGEKVTLTYKTSISSNQEPGIYKDLAWTKGTHTSNAASASFLGNPGTGIFVGTAVAISLDDLPEVKVEVEERVKEIEEEGEVLGAAILPATGAPNFWIMLIITVLLGGLTVILAGLFIKKAKKGKGIMIALAMFVTFMALSSQSVYADLSVEVEEPESPNNQDSIALNFVTLDTDGGAVTVKCYVKKPGEVAFSQFGSDIVTTAGGNTGFCPATSGVLATEGIYEFYVTASASGLFETSSTVSVAHDSKGPGKPHDLDKDRNGSCKYDISFKTDDDGGETVRVEVYRSDDKEFQANSSTRIKDIAVGSDTKVEFTNDRPTCGKTYYYAVIAFDAADNRSSVLSEKVTKEKTITVESDSGSATVPGDLVEAIAVGLGIADTAETDEDAISEDPTLTEEELMEIIEGPEVLGLQEEQQPILARVANLLKIPVILLLVVIVLAYVRKKLQA